MWDKKSNKISDIIDTAKNYIQNNEGSTAIEYSLIATGISIAVAAVVYLLGDDVAALYEGLIGLL